MGMRSAKFAEMLIEKGFKNVSILEGGLMAYGDKDPSIFNGW